MNTQKSSLLSLHLSVLILGITALFSKIITLSSQEISLYRSLFACLAIFLVIIMNRQAILLKSKSNYFIVFVMGLLLAAHWVTFFHAMQVSSVAIGVIALYTYPVITVFIEPLFHGERPKTSDMLCAMAVFFGVYLMMPSLSLNNQTTLGILWGTMSAVFFSLRNIIHVKYFTHCSAKQALLYQSLVVVLVLLPFSVDNIHNPSSTQWAQLLLLGVLFTALPHTLFAYSLRHLKAKTGSLIACLQVVYATLFAALLLNEFPDESVIFGGTLIVSAAIYESFSKK